MPSVPKKDYLSSGALDDRAGKKTLDVVHLEEEYMHNLMCMLETDTTAMLSGAEQAGNVRREVIVYIKWVDPLNANWKIKYCYKEILICQLSQ